MLQCIIHAVVLDVGLCKVHSLKVSNFFFSFYIYIETLAGFRVALKRSHSRSHQNDSTSSGRQPSYGRQASTASHESSAFHRQGSRESRERSLSEGGGGEREGEEGGAEGEGEPEIETETQEVFLDVMKSISLENIPGAAHPSPYTTRKSLKSASDKVLHTYVHACM